MRLTKIALTLIIAIMIPGFLSYAEPINIVDNGSFEYPSDVPLGQWIGIGFPYGGTSSNTMGAWTVAWGTVDLGNQAWQAADGNQSVDMNGNQPGSIYQYLATEPGQQYVLSFSLSGCPGWFRHISVSWDGVQIASLEFDARYTSLWDMGWETHTYYVTATGFLTRLQFESGDPSQSGAYLDNVSVVALEPDLDGDGIPDAEDQCPNSILSRAIVINTCDSGVMNPLFPSGCTINDDIKHLIEISNNPRHFGSRLNQYLNRILSLGIITDEQRESIQDCTSESSSF